VGVQLPDAAEQLVVRGEVQHLLRGATRARGELDDLARGLLQPVPAGLHVVEDQVARDGDEPRTDVPALVADRRDAAQGPDEGLLGEVLGQGAVAGAEEHVPEDDVVVAVEQFAEGDHVAFLRRLHQRPGTGALVGLRRPAPARGRVLRGGLAGAVPAGERERRAGGARARWRPGRTDAGSCGRGHLYLFTRRGTGGLGGEQPRLSRGTGHGSRRALGPGRWSVRPSSGRRAERLRNAQASVGSARGAPAATGSMPLPRVSFATISWVGR